MKKFLFILVLFLVPLSAFPLGNSLQQEDENVIRGLLRTPVGSLSQHYAALKLDYINYKLNKEKTVFAQISDLEKKYADKNPDTNINSKYLQNLKDLYFFVVSYDDNDTISTEFMREFNKRRIVVPDEEYRVMDEELKVLLSVVNVYN